MYSPRNLLILNVGFIVHQTVGYLRDFPIEAPFLRLPPDLELHNFAGNVRVTRTAQGLLLQANLNASIQMPCVRCLAEVSQMLQAEFTDLYAFNRNSMTQAGLLLPDTGKIDLSETVREEMLLATPINALCSHDCKGLCPVCGENLNTTSCSHENEEPDPRLDVLRSLLDDDQPAT